MKDLTSTIIAYEEGTLSDEQVLELFQYLVDTGMAWTLQGHYGRTAIHLIEGGYIHNTPRRHVPGRTGEES